MCSLQSTTFLKRQLSLTANEPSTALQLGHVRQLLCTSREVNGKFASENVCSCRRFWRFISFDAIHTSTLLHLHRASRSHLYSMPRRRYNYGVTLELHGSIN